MGNTVVTGEAGKRELIREMRTTTGTKMIELIPGTDVAKTIGKELETLFGVLARRHVGGWKQRIRL